MLTLLGVLALIASVTFFILKGISKSKWEEYRKKEANGDRYLSEPDIPESLQNTKYNFIFLVLGIVLIGVGGLFFFNPSGTVTSIQYPWGGDKMVKTQGPKLKFWGKTIPISYEISIKDIIQKVDSEGEINVEIPPSGDGIYNRAASRWEFSDAIKADIGVAVIIGVNTDDEEAFLDMADKNRSEGKLIQGRVLPNIDAALKNTCKLMDAQEYISGKASDFDIYFRDQLQNGMYLVEEYIEEEQVTEIIGDTNTVRMVGNTNVNKQTKYRIKRDTQGNIMRASNSNTLKQYGITIYQAQVTGIDWEESFDERLQLQKEQVAQTQLEKQEAEKEYYRAKKEIAKGESEKAAERARLEKEQIKLTIAAETEAKVAEQNVIAEKKKLEVAKLASQSKKVAADAQYYENAKLVAAGLTPQERAELERQIAVGVATELAKIKMPEVYMEGGTGNSKGGLLESLIGADLAKKMSGQ
jgi:hypothetical protein